MKILKLYTDFWTLGMWSFSSYSRGVRLFLNNARMKMSLGLFVNPLLEEKKG